MSPFLYLLYLEGREDIIGMAAVVVMRVVEGVVMGGLVVILVDILSGLVVRVVGRWLVGVETIGMVVAAVVVMRVVEGVVMVAGGLVVIWIVVMELVGVKSICQVHSRTMLCCDIVF